jgi:hypothetical protein
MKRKNQEEQYKKWRGSNEDIFKLFELHALKKLDLNEKFSVRAFLHVIRWEFRFSKRDTPYKICDHHSPYIARELIKKYPKLGKLIALIPTMNERQTQEFLEDGEYL